MERLGRETNFTWESLFGWTCTIHPQCLSNQDVYAATTTTASAQNVEIQKDAPKYYEVVKKIFGGNSPTLRPVANKFTLLHGNVWYRAWCRYLYLGDRRTQKLLFFRLRDSHSSISTEGGERPSEWFKFCYPALFVLVSSTVSMSFALFSTAVDVLQISLSSSASDDDGFHLYPLHTTMRHNSAPNELVQLFFTFHVRHPLPRWASFCNYVDRVQAWE